MKIFLTGMPAAGKTTLGKALVQVLPLPFFDLDLEIEKVTTSTISTLFKNKSEGYFRTIEAATLRKFINEEDKFVMAVGGGTPCFYNNMACINKAGISIFLNLSTASLVKRFNQSTLLKRPLLKNISTCALTHALAKIHQQRITYYQQATMIIAEQDVSLVALVKKIQNFSN